MGFWEWHLGFQDWELGKPSCQPSTRISRPVLIFLGAWKESSGELARRGRHVSSWPASYSTWSVHSKREARGVSPLRWLGGSWWQGGGFPRVLTAVFLPRYLRKAFFPKHQDLQFAGTAGVPGPFPIVLRHQETIQPHRWMQVGRPTGSRARP